MTAVLAEKPAAKAPYFSFSLQPKDRVTANLEVARWLREVANARVHAKTGCVLAQRLEQERGALQRLPSPYRGAVSPARVTEAQSMRKALVILTATALLSCPKWYSTLRTVPD